MNGQTEAVSKIDELNYYSPHFAYDIKTANDYKKPIAYKNLHRHPKEKSTVNKNGYLEIIRKHPGKGPTETFIIYYHQICTGVILAFSSSETVDSAAEKCLNLNCSAVNAKPVGYDILKLPSISGSPSSTGYWLLAIRMRHFREEKNSSKKGIYFYIYSVFL
ncbi:unnamed protein product [Dracunculus medinensis]|uniref:Alpha/beta-hydrolase n=1 Tax=Dracunculus medinensis TaxID=318479 RepID=A0A0N4U738_DRAME|nr:unnamed protein product [Dracunculus medinensis]